MNATQTDHLLTAVADYVEQVRAALSWQDRDDVAELTDGLERDLAESLQDSFPGVAEVDLVQHLGEPAAYAAELCAAAGVAVPTVGPRSRPNPLVLLRRQVADWRGHAGWQRAGAVLRELAPLWWLVRAWLLYQVLMWVNTEWSTLDVFPLERDGVPNRWQTAVLLIVLALGSVLLGLGSRSRRWALIASRVVTIAALVVAMPVAVFTYESRFYAGDNVVYLDREVTVEVPGTPQDGVWVDGMQVSNLFAYDAEGNPLADVQLYDDRGRPVETVNESGRGLWPENLALPGVSELWTFSSTQDADGRTRWNVYPLQGSPSDPDGGTTGDSRQPPAPFAKAPAVTEPADG